MPKCESCGTELSSGSICDQNHSNNFYYVLVEGYCPKCGQRYSWVEVYSFSGFETLEKIEE